MSDPTIQVTDPTTYPALISELIAKLPEPLAVEERAYYAASITDEDARKAGAAFESASILDELIRIAAPALPHIIAKEVAGYGPLRARYILDLGHELSTRVAAFDISRVDAAGAGAASTSSLRGTRALRRQALRALKNLAGKRAEERARARKAAEGEEKADERARSLQVIAEELETVVAKVPERVAVDAGVTPELMKALRSSATAVLTARSKANDSRSSVASLYDEMNILDGRLLHELRLLLGALRDARAANPLVPKLRSKLIQRSGKKQKKDAGATAASSATPTTPQTTTPTPQTTTPTTPQTITTPTTPQTITAPTPQTTTPPTPQTTTAPTTPASPTTPS